MSAEQRFEIERPLRREAVVTYAARDRQTGQPVQLHRLPPGGEGDVLLAHLDALGPRPEVVAVEQQAGFRYVVTVPLADGYRFADWIRDQAVPPSEIVAEDHGPSATTMTGALLGGTSAVPSGSGPPPYPPPDLFPPAPHLPPPPLPLPHEEGIASQLAVAPAWLPASGPSVPPMPPPPPVSSAPPVPRPAPPVPAAAPAAAAPRGKMPMAVILGLLLAMVLVAALAVIAFLLLTRQA